MKKLLFVYGTLRAAASNPCERYGGVHVGPATFKGADLFDLGWYPGIKLGSENEVVGDLYEVDQSIIPSLDAYEGTPHLYTRHSLEGTQFDTQVNLSKYEGQVMLYEYNGYPSNRPRIESGDWLNYVKKEENYDG